MTAWRATALALALTATLALPRPAAALEVLAFGDSMTAGTGDEDGKGYPRRLKRMLDEDSEVHNFGVEGEETPEGLSRLDSVLGTGGDVVLLMEGTNDITRISVGAISMESTLANLDAMITKSRAAGIEPVLATVVPRPPSAKRDRHNLLTTEFAGEIRELGYQRGVRFADPFDLFDPELLGEELVDFFSADPDDKVGHLNGDGYDILASAFADLLNDVDSASPVVGNFEPGPLPNEIPGGIPIRVPVYDFHADLGLDLEATRLLINGTVVSDGNTSEGDAKRVVLTHQGSKALGCRAVLRIQAQDLASPPNVLDRTLAIYAVEGKQVLPGDNNFDCDVDGVDLVAFALRFGIDSSNPLYQLPFDLNRDGIVDLDDLEIVSENFGKSTD